MLKIKLFAVFVILAFASCAFLFSNDKTQAQSGKRDEKRDQILEKIAGYKSWKQVQKPVENSDLSILKSNEPTYILDSTAMG